MLGATKMVQTPNILKTLQDQGNKAADGIAQKVIRKKALLPQVFKGVSSDNKRLKNAAAKTAKIISDHQPDMLYPHFDFFAALLAKDDTILKWTALDVIGNLAFVDIQNKINKRVIDKLFVLLSDESMITAGHSVDNLGKIAIAKPRFRQPISAALLKVGSTKRDDECRNILIGKVILSLSLYVEYVKDRNKILKFVKKQLNNSRAATRNKAAAFLKKFT